MWDGECRLVPHLDAVLISHADLAHAGGLPFLVGRYGLKCPIIATVPVPRLCMRLLYDTYQNYSDRREFTAFSMSDIDDAFENAIQLKYSQRYHLTGKGEGVSVTPFCAGHTLGGAVWRIEHDLDDVVYMMNVAHRPDRYAWEEGEKKSFFFFFRYHSLSFTIGSQEY